MGYIKILDLIDKHAYKRPMNYCLVISCFENSNKYSQNDLSGNVFLNYFFKPSFSIHFRLSTMYIQFLRLIEVKSIINKKGFVLNSHLFYKLSYVINTKYHSVISVIYYKTSLDAI